MLTPVINTFTKTDIFYECIKVYFKNSALVYLFTCHLLPPHCKALKDRGCVSFILLFPPPSIFYGT